MPEDQQEPTPDESEATRVSFHTVLMVDDESCVLNSLVRELRKEPYHLITAGSAREGLELLRERKVSVILSDMRMPQMSGVEFLTAATEVSPDSVKMILSGYSDADLVMSAINSGIIWRYLTKPWQTDDLKVALRNAAELYAANDERRQLLLQLRMKNEELADWSRRLEDTVREQTRELYNQGVLLRMILDGCGFEALLPALCSNIQALFHSDQIYLCLDSGNRWLQANGDAPTALPLEHGQLATGIAAVCAERRCSQQAGAVFCPLYDEEETYGVILICGTTANLEPLETYLEGYAAIVSIALRQQKLGRDSGAIIRNIDALLGELK